MRKLFFVLSVLMLVTVSGCSQASGPTITISEVWSRPAISGGTGGVFFVINNAGSSPDSLRSATADVAKTTEIHQTKMEGGMMKMSPVEAINVPAQGKVELKPGGYHVMLVDLKQELKVGDTFKLIVEFEKAGKMTFEVKVRQP